MFMVVMTATAAGAVRMVVVMMPFPCPLRCFVPGVDFYFSFYSPGNGDQFRDQRIRIFCGEPQLLGGKGDGCFLHQFVCIEFAFNFGSTVGTVQIIYDIDFSCHGNASLLYDLTYEQSFICYKQYTCCCKTCQ